VTITFKSTVDAGVTAGQVKIATTAALTVTNLVAFLNAPNTTVADAANAGYKQPRRRNDQRERLHDQQGGRLAWSRRHRR